MELGLDKGDQLNPEERKRRARFNAFDKMCAEFKLLPSSLSNLPENELGRMLRVILKNPSIPHAGIGEWAKIYAASFTP